jgi:hypothetical protein
VRSEIVSWRFLMMHQLSESAYSLLWWHGIIAWQDQGRKNGIMHVIFVAGLRQMKQESEVRYNFYLYHLIY